MPGHVPSALGSQSQYGRPSCSPLTLGASGEGRVRRSIAGNNDRPMTTRNSNPTCPAARASTTTATSRWAVATSVELAREFGTPAYVYAEDDIRSRAQEYLDAFRARTDDFEVVYASKAAPIGAIFRLVSEMGLSVDVASARRAPRRTSRRGVDPARIYLHGNNKTETDLRLAIEAGVGRIVCDSFDEIERLDAHPRPPAAGDDPRHARDQGQHPQLHPDGPARLEVRLRHSRTASPRGGSRRSAESSNLELAGLHAHIGSQIFELEPYVKTIEALGRLADEAGLTDDELSLLNVGGGLGIAYEPGDEPPSIESYVDVKVKGVERVFDPVPRILVEPGRSLVGNAGITLYEVGTVKEIPGVRTYVAVDGGMSDNLRPMLYDARYDALDREPRLGCARHARDGRRDALRVERHHRARRRNGGTKGGRRPGNSGDGCVRSCHGEQLQRHAAPAGDLREGRRGPRGRSPRDPRRPGGARCPVRPASGSSGEEPSAAPSPSWSRLRADAVAEVAGEPAVHRRRPAPLGRATSTRSSPARTSSSS